MSSKFWLQGSIHVLIATTKGMSLSLVAMEMLHTFIREMKAQGPMMAASIKAMADTVSAMGLWMPQVTGSIDTLNTSIEVVGARVAVLKAEHNHVKLTRTSRHEGHDMDGHPDVAESV